MDEFDLAKDDRFVDIHGREIPIRTLGIKQEEVCLLTDLKQTGVGIYQKSQYAKLSTVKKDFGPDFVDHMLEAAKSYMLANKISFKEAQIMRSIEHCKQYLTNNQTPVQQPSQQFILNNRVVETGSDEEIRIQVVNRITPKSSQTPKTKSLLPKAGQQKSQLPTTPQRNFPKKGVSPQKGNLLQTKNENQEKICTNTGNGQGVPKLRQPKRISYNIPQAEHDVMVTAIDKPNCVWVRDLMNSELLDKIHKKVNEEARFQKAAMKPWVMDKVYLAKEEDSWFRCRIFRYSPLTVLFLDYGNVAEVDEIKEVSEELANTPCVAVRITFKESEYTPKLEDIIRIKRFMKNADGTLFVNIVKNSCNVATPMVIESFKSPRIAVSENVTSKRLDNGVENSVAERRDSDSWDSSDETSTPIKNDEVVEEVAFFKRPPFLGILENDQRVSISHVKGDVIYLKTKECFEKLREIDDVIENYAKTAKSIRKVKVDQLVLYEEDGKFARAVVTKLDGNNVDIELLDYGECKTVAQTLLKSISEDLSRAPVTNFPAGKLAGFESGLDNSHKRVIEKYAKKRKKFSVSVGFDDELDLYDGKQLLSDELQNMEKVPQKMMLNDIKTYKPEIGIKAYLCGSYNNSSEVTFVPSNALETNVDLVTRSDVQDVVPYSPVFGEVCLCYYLGHWYRCVVIRIFEKICQVMLLDFGNVEYIKKEDLRKPDKKTTEIPALAIPCVLVGLPEHPNVENMLKELILVTEIYNVDVKRISGGKCDVEIPTVYKKIRDSI